MKKIIKDPFADLVLDSYEQEIEDAFPKNAKKLFDIPKKEKPAFDEIEFARNLISCYPLQDLKKSLEIPSLQ